MRYGVQGLWFVVCGLWFVVCGLWFVVCGLWFVVCGLWSVVYDSGSGFTCDILLIDPHDALAHHYASIGLS